jgi:hypothetical protein
MTRTRRENPLPLSNILDATLHSSEGQLLGVVDELLINRHTGRVEYLLAVDPAGQRMQVRWGSVGIRDGAFVAYAWCPDWEPAPDRHGT